MHITRGSSIKARVRSFGTGCDPGIPRPVICSFCRMTEDEGACMNVEDLTPKSIIEQHVGAALSVDPGLAEQINASIQFYISGPNGGEWFLDFRRMRHDVRQGCVSDPNLTVWIGDEDFVNVVRGQMSPFAAFLRGRIR